MKNRPGQHARLEIRAGWLRALQKHLSLWISLLVVVVVCLVLFAVVPMPSSLRGFWIGFLVAAVLAGFAWMLQILSNTHGWSMGKVGEEATAEAVAGWRRRWKGWRLINGLYLAGHGDIDHVLVGPGGVFVIESKWTSRDCRIELGEIVGLMGRVPIAQAFDGALKVERLLRYGSQRFDVTVKPVVVIWGPGTLSLEGGSTDIDGVLVCEGRRYKEWVRKLAGSAIEQPEVEAIASVLEDQVARRIDQVIH